MARRKVRQRKIKPAELTLNFTVTAGTHYIDIAQCLSMLNRSFYRQGMQYAVQSVELVSTGASTMTIQRIANSWPCVNSHTKGYALWKKQQDETMEQSGSRDTIAKYRDFKVAMNQHHSTTGFGTNLLTQNMPNLATVQGVSASATYEWEQSEVIIPNDGGVGTTSQMPLHWVGQDIPGANTSKSLVKAYADSRSRPFQTDPNIVDVPLGGLFGEMFDVGDDDYDIITNAQEENNVPPYYIDMDTGIEFYPGGQGLDTGATSAGGIVYEWFLSTAATGRFISSYGGSAVIPAGLLQVVHSGEGAFLRIKIAPGNYKGCAARAMRDVN